MMKSGDIAGLLIRQARLRLNWSQEGLCRGICAPSYLSKIEQGKAAPSPEVTELLLRRLGLVWTPEPESLEPCWKALLSGSPDFVSCYERLVQPRQEILACSPLAADALLLDAFYEDNMRSLPEEWESFLSNRQLALQRGLQGRWEEAVRLELPAESAYYPHKSRLPLGGRRRVSPPDAVLPSVDGQLLLGSGPHGGDAGPLRRGGASGGGLG